MPKSKGPEKEPISLTRDEFDKLANSVVSVTDTDFLNLLTQKGIALDSGIVDVEIDGKKNRMNTDSADFGTLVDH